MGSKIIGISRKIRIIGLIKIIGIIVAVCHSASSIVVEQMSTPTSKRRVSEPDQDGPSQDGPDQSPRDQGSSSESKIN